MELLKAVPKPSLHGRKAAPDDLSDVGQRELVEHPQRDDLCLTARQAAQILLDSFEFLNGFDLL